MQVYFGQQRRDHTSLLGTMSVCLCSADVASPTIFIFPRHGRLEPHPNDVKYNAVHTLLPRATKALGQLLERDFNPEDKLLLLRTVSNSNLLLEMEDSSILSHQLIDFISFCYCALSSKDLKLGHIN